MDKRRTETPGKAPNSANCATAHGLFRFCAEWISLAVGSSWAFVLAVLVIIGWALTGPLFGFSDTWQLVINTATSLATFLMVFIIQNTQNRDSTAMQLKLDELIRITEGAHNVMIGLEEEGQSDLDKIKAQ